MRTRYTLGSLGVLVFVVVLGQIFAQTPSIQGVWRVTEVVVTGAGARTNKAPQPGLYIFTKQHYSFMTDSGVAPRKSYLRPGSAPETLSDAEKLERFVAWNDFIANAGTYQIKGSTLTTTAMVAKNPGVVATTQTREFKIAGNTLTLVQKSAADQPASETTTRLTRIE